VTVTTSTEGGMNDDAVVSTTSSSSITNSQNNNNNVANDNNTSTTANDAVLDYRGKAVMLPHQVKVVGIFEQEWAEAKHTRGKLLISQLKSFAKSMAVKVGIVC